MSEVPSLATSLHLLGPSPVSGMAGPASQPTPPRRAMSVTAPIDWPLVTQLRREASERIAAAGDQWLRERGERMPEEDRRVRARSIIRSVVHAHAQRLSEDGEALWPMTVEHRYADAVESAIFGYGRLQPLFEIPGAENIEFQGFDSVMVQYGDGRRIEHPRVADSDEELVEAIRFLGETASPPRPFDDTHPTMTVALGTQFRLHAIAFGLSHRPSAVIRQHQLTAVTLDDLASGGLLPRELADLLRACVLARKSIVISGDQAAGGKQPLFA